jgi:hypothetical protein
MTEHRATDCWALPLGPLYQALLGEAQPDPTVAAGLNERFIRPQTEKTIARLKAAQAQG